MAIEWWIVTVTFKFIQYPCKHFTTCALSACLVLLHMMFPFSSPVCWRGNVMHEARLSLIFKVVVPRKQSFLGHMFVGSFFFVLVHRTHTWSMAAFFRNTLYILTAYIVLTLITYEHLFCNKIFFSSETVLSSVLCNTWRCSDVKIIAKLQWLFRF